MLQKSPQGIQNKPRGTLVRPHYDLIFRLNLVVEFSILCSTVRGVARGVARRVARGTVEQRRLNSTTRISLKLRS